MKTTRNLFYILILCLLFSCKNASVNNTDTIHSETNNKDSSNDTNQTDAYSTLSNDEPIIDTITTIKYNELTISINRLVIYDEENKLKQLQKDTVELYAELGENIEGKRISISSNQLTNIIVEQCYETSISIQNEGPHCDLTEWTHYYSDWNLLTTTNSGQFICDKYTEKQNQKFLNIPIEDVKQKVKEQCGNDWFTLVENITSPTEYPSSVAISRYFIKVSGIKKDTGQTVTKLIIIEVPMGC